MTSAGRWPCSPRWRCWRPGWRTPRKVHTGQAWVWCGAGGRISRAEEPWSTGLGPWQLQCPHRRTVGKIQTWESSKSSNYWHYHRPLLSAGWKFIRNLKSRNKHLISSQSYLVSLSVLGVGNWVKSPPEFCCPEPPGWDENIFNSSY